MVAGNRGNPNGNPDIAKIGEATQFGNGQDPREAGAKAATWSIRNMVRYFAANNIALDDSTAIKRFLGKEPTVAQVIALRSLQKAMAGDMRAVEYATEQIDGKVPQRNEITGKDGGPLEINEADAAKQRLLRGVISDASASGADSPS